MAAVAAGALFLAAERTFRALGVGNALAAVALAVGATWLAAGSYGWWFQAVRPEVYALHAALVGLAIERITALEERWPTADMRPLYVAALAIGLALSNHHFLAFLVLPAIAPTAARVWRAHGTKPLFKALAAGLLGLSTYAYLPARAAAEPWLNLGSPDSLSRFYWVVSAQAFQKNTGEGVPEPMVERFFDVAASLVQSLHLGVVVAALMGAYVVVRLAPARRIGVVWILLIVVHIVARAWLGFVRSNPDALGYLMPALGALAVLAVGTVAAIVGTATENRKVLAVVGVVVALLGLGQLARSAERSSLASFTATDAFDEHNRRALPPRAVVLAHVPQTIFRFWGGEGSELVRPDVTLIPIPLLTYPEMANSIVSTAPEVGGVLRGHLLSDRLGESELQSLAATRPLMLEMDVRIPPALYETVVPFGLYHEVLPDSAYPDDRRAGAAREQHVWKQLYRLIGMQRREAETKTHLLWHHYMEALYYAAVGEREDARVAVRRALAVNPEAEELVALRRALSNRRGTGPLDITPFITTGSE
jgi:hypothetical protein